MRLLLKMFLVLGMTIAIMIPLMMIRGTISERQMYRSQAVDSIARSYAGAQAFAGPVLVVPYVETIEVEEKDDKGKVIRKVKVDGASGRWTFFPDRLDIDGKLTPATRRLGLHEVRVYELQALATANFNARIPADANPELPRKIGRPWLSYGVADVRGLIGTPRLRIDDRDVALEEGFGSREGGGVHVRLAKPLAGQDLRLSTRLGFTLGGTESLALVPLAKNSVFKVNSSWPHPRFGGSFLPRSRDVAAQGFRAQWEISSLATNAQAQFLAGKTLPSVGTTSRHQSDEAAAIETGGIDAVGVSLVDPVNVYSQADRASKYGLLFVLLTFVGFFMFELIKQLPIHPVQYGLVGLSLAIFFLLLVSLSEHIRFGLAYVAASVACIGLLGFYLSAVLRSVGRGLGFAAMLTMLYAALYGLLVSEDNALVLGSGLLFVILATLMVVTRKVDWYQLGGARIPPMPRS
jgi:inner membrane protein